MILKVLICIVGCFVGCTIAASVDCNIEQCAKPMNLYEELGCKAVFGTQSCCAKRFDCPDFKQLDDDKCTFEGKEYAIGEILPRNITSNTKCVETCFCTRQGNEPAKFACSNSDCGVSSLKLPGCINIYGDLHECCSTSIICDEVEKESLATCFVEKEYREGEKFIPASNPCYECLCHREFDNTTIANNPHCRKVNCEIDLRFKSFVQRGCLPVFTSEKCCPVDWECPKSIKKVIKRSVDDSDETTEKGQTVFVVTPSKNMEQFLAAIENANPVWSTLPDSPVTEASSTTSSTTAFPTLSTDPFQTPSDFTTVPVSASVEDSTTPLERAFAEFSTEAFTSKAETTATESTTVQTSTTTTSTTTEAQTTKKSSSEEYISLSSELNESSGSEETKETKESNETSAPTTSTTTTTTVPIQEIDVRSSAPLEASTTTTTTTEEPTTVAATTTLSSEIQKAIQDIGRSLEAFEDPLATAVPQTTTQAAPQTSSPEESAPAHSSTTEAATTVTTTEAAPATESTPAASSTAKLFEDQPTTTSSLAESTTPTFPGLSPTELDKLLSSLRQYDAQVEALTSTPPPQPLLSEGVQVEMKTEFVNYTVSSESREFKDEPRPISKRSVPDVDLIPRYFKHIAAAKAKGCAYNGRSFKLGEVIKTDNECLKCFCEYAPIGHCVLKEKCNF